jgi:hypothetical protein
MLIKFLYCIQTTSQNKTRGRNRYAYVDPVTRRITARAGSNLIRYSVAITCLLNNNRFRCQGNAVTVNLTWQRMRNVRASIFLICKERLIRETFPFVGRTERTEVPTLTQEMY